MASVITLTPSDLEFGHNVTAELKKKKFPYCGVFWLYDDNFDDWRLIVATGLVDEVGPRETYLRLSKITDRVAASDFQLLRITVISPKRPIYAALRSVFGSAKSVEGARLDNTTVNGFSVTAYLYEVG